MSVLRGELDVVAAREAARIEADLVAFGNYDRHGIEHFIGGKELGLLHRTHSDLLAVSEGTPDAAYAQPLVALNLDGLERDVLDGANGRLPDPLPSTVSR